MSTQHPSPEKLSKEDAHSPSSRIPLIQGNLTMWRGGIPGEVLGERRFFRLWDRELVHYECDALQCKSDFETVDLTQASIDYLRRTSGSGGPTAAGGLLYCEVRPRHCAEDSFILKATTSEEMQRWVILMQQQSQHHRENDRILLFEQVIAAIATDTSDIQERKWAASPLTSSSSASTTAAASASASSAAAASSAPSASSASSASSAPSASSASSASSAAAAPAAAPAITPPKAAAAASDVSIDTIKSASSTPALNAERTAALGAMSIAELKRLSASNGIDTTHFIEKDDFLRALTVLQI